MIAELIISTACLAANGVSPSVQKSTGTFEIPAACLAKRPTVCADHECGVLSNGSYWYVDNTSLFRCSAKGRCEAVPRPRSPAPEVLEWWKP